MIVYPAMQILTLTHLEQADLGVIRGQILKRPLPHDFVERQELIFYLLYDLLGKMGFQTTHRMGILEHFKDSLLKCGVQYAATLKHEAVPLTMLQIMDNRYASVVGIDEIYDFKATVSLRRIQTPIVSLVVVLPKLYWHGLLALESPSGQRVSVSDPTDPSST